MSHQFWKTAEPLILITEKHPFLTSMVDGTLSEEKFRYYVIQDALYLADFAACLRHLSQTASSPADKKRLAELADGAENDEMALHRSFFTKWNITGARDTKQMPQTLLYTSYMIRIVFSRPYAEGLAVLLPCFWVYMHVGKKMLQLRETLGGTTARPPPYDAWIDMYAGDEFEKEVTDYRQMVDDAMTEADEDTIKKMEEHFLMSCRLEHMFWDQANDLVEWPTIK